MTFAKCLKDTCTPLSVMKEAVDGLIYSVQPILADHQLYLHIYQKGDVIHVICQVLYNQMKAQRKV